MWPQYELCHGWYTAPRGSKGFRIQRREKQLDAGLVLTQCLLLKWLAGFALHGITLHL
jgi:hypothetical protein